MLVFLLFSVLILVLFHELYWKRRNLPPGPTPIPFIGNVLSMRNPKPGYDAFERYNKQFGGMYTYWIGTQPYILIGDYELIKETFIRDGDTYVDKVQQEFQLKFRDGSWGVIETNGEQWREHRRFALHQLRDFGLGKDLMQQKILLEVDALTQFFNDNIDKELDLTETFDVCVGNIINQTLFGYRFDGENQHKFTKLKKFIDFQTEVFADFKILIQFLVPWLTKIIPGKNPEEIFDGYKREVFGFFQAQIDEHKAEIDFEQEESQDYVEAYLKEQKKREEAGDVESFCDKQLVNICFDLWLAGLVTTTTTISWTLAYVLNFDGVQQKLHDELDRVIGSDRVVTMSDKADLVYMSAFINEVQRYLNMIPINLLHCTTRDTVIKGFPVKKGTGVIAQISTVMFDEKHFPEPRTFKPERFIEDGKLKKVDELLPFSVGKRQCLGEGLARMELFLFIANFFNRYKILPGADGPPCIDKSKDSFIMPRVFKAKLERRYV